VSVTQPSEDYLDRRVSELHEHLDKAIKEMTDSIHILIEISGEGKRIYTNSYISRINDFTIVLMKARNELNSFVK